MSSKRQRGKKIQEILSHYFPDPPIPLKHESPYTLLIAVLLSAQSTDARVNQITPILFAKANTPQKMIELSIEEIYGIIKSCGLGPSKAKSILELSKILVDKYASVVPKTFEELESLPGVGHKTASVVMAQAFHIPAFPVDTHIHRCAKRWGLSNGENVIQTEKDLKAAFSKKDWIKLHLQIIYFARKYCPAIKHNRTECPICSTLG